MADSMKLERMQNSGVAEAALYSWGQRPPRAQQKGCGLASGEGFEHRNRLLPILRTFVWVKLNTVGLRMYIPSKR